VIDLGRSCSRYRPLLEDFVDRGEVRPETGAALEHLDRCGRCTEAIESTMLTITALRRIGDDVVDAEPAADAWPRLRVRITSWRRRPAVMSPIAGIAMSFAIVTVLVLPFRTAGIGPGDGTGPTGVPGAAPTLEERLVEDAYLARQRTLSASAGDPEEDASSSGSYRRTYPDNYRPTRKEVDPAQATGRSPRAI